MFKQTADCPGASGPECLWWYHQSTAKSFERQHIILAVRAVGKAREHAQCAALVVWWPRVLLVWDPVAPTDGEAGKLETLVLLPFLSQSTSAAEKPHFSRSFSQTMPWFILSLPSPN